MLVCLVFLGVGPWYFTVYLYTEWACWCGDVPYLLESASLVMFIGSNSKSLVCYWWEPFRSDLYTWWVSCKLIFPTILLVCCHSLGFSIYKKKNKILWWLRPKIQLEALVKYVNMFLMSLFSCMLVWDGPPCSCNILFWIRVLN